MLGREVSLVQPEEKDGQEFLRQPEQEESLVSSEMGTVTPPLRPLPLTVEVESLSYC